MKLLASLACLFAISMPIAAFATSQIPDSIVVDGQSGALYGAIPDVPYVSMGYQAKRLIAGTVNDPDYVAATERLKAYIVHETCSASWRGYEAAWAVRADKLFLVGLTFAPCGSKRHVPITVLFPDAVDGALATWANGKLIAPIGAIKHDAGSIWHFDAYWELQVDKGVVTSRTRVDQPLRLQ